MKAKKYLTMITGGFSLLSLVMAWWIGKSSNSTLYDVSMAAFGSALLGVIMSLTEYFVERRKAMEQFWNEARKVLHELRKIRYINTEAPHDLIHACFVEEESNKWQQLFSENQSETARKNLISWFKENGVVPLREDDDDIEAVLNQIYEERMEYFHKEYQRAIDSYADAANIDIDQLGNAYAGLDFFFNKRIRNKAYNEVYQKIREFIRQLHQESYHFNLLRENQGRFSICADKAYQICQYAFMEKNDEASDAWKKIIYQGLFDDIDETLEWFRCEIYRNEKYKPVEKIPFLAVGNAFNEEKK